MNLVNYKAIKFTAEPLQDCCASASSANDSKHHLPGWHFRSYTSARPHFHFGNFFAKPREISKRRDLTLLGPYVAEAFVKLPFCY
jgi:hypothetical protein